MLFAAVAEGEGDMTTAKKQRKTRGVSSSLPLLSLQLFGFFLSMAGFFLALVGFIGIFTSSGGTAVAILVVGGLMTVLGVVLARWEKAAKIGLW
jgi:hypothetical protein